MVCKYTFRVNASIPLLDITLNDVVMAFVSILLFAFTNFGNLEMKNTRETVPVSATSS